MLGGNAEATAEGQKDSKATEIKARAETTQVTEHSRTMDKVVRKCA